MQIELDVNGTVQALDLVDPDTPLAYVLRNALGLTGTKIACGQEQCGACAVLCDGEVRLSCVTPAAAFAGRRIVTTEGLADTAVGRRARRAFVEAGAAQCGYCSAGIVVRLAALASARPTVTPQRARAALDDHLCRCGAHPRVLAALDALLADTP